MEEYLETSEAENSRRISVDLPTSLIEKLNELKKDWGLRSRGDVLNRLLEDLLCENLDQEEILGVDLSNVINDTENSNKSISNNFKDDEIVYNETKALVLISNESNLIDIDDKSIITSDNNLDTEPTRTNERKTGIDLPTFVQKKTRKLKTSIGKNRFKISSDESLLKPIKEKELTSGLVFAKQHWLNLYGQSPKPEVVEAAMIWLARDIWPLIHSSDQFSFTWTAANKLMNQYCSNWELNKPTLEIIIVIAAVLEDPFACENLPARIPTLVRRFTSRFRKNQNLTSFQALESTMTVHGALKILGIPTKAGSKLTLRLIRDAYKTKALTIHPDAGGTNDQMRRLNEGYQLLKELYRNK